MKNIYDTLVIELQKDGKSVGSISIKKTDIDTLISLHDQKLNNIVADATQTLMDGVEHRNKQN